MKQPAVAVTAASGGGANFITQHSPPPMEQQKQHLLRTRQTTVDAYMSNKSDQQYHLMNRNSFQEYNNYNPQNQLKDQHPAVTATPSAFTPAMTSFPAKMLTTHYEQDSIGFRNNHHLSHSHYNASLSGNTQKWQQGRRKGNSVGVVAHASSNNASAALPTTTSLIQAIRHEKPVHLEPDLKFSFPITLVNHNIVYSDKSHQLFSPFLKVPFQAPRIYDAHRTPAQQFQQNYIHNPPASAGSTPQKTLLSHEHSAQKIPTPLDIISKSSNSSSADMNIPNRNNQNNSLEASNNNGQSAGKKLPEIIQEEDSHIENQTGDIAAGSSSSVVGQLRTPQKLRNEENSKSEQQKRQPTIIDVPPPESSRKNLVEKIISRNEPASNSSLRLTSSPNRLERVNNQQQQQVTSSSLSMNLAIPTTSQVPSSMGICATKCVDLILVSNPRAFLVSLREIKAIFGESKTPPLNGCIETTMLNNIIPKSSIIPIEILIDENTSGSSASAAGTGNNNNNNNISSSNTDIPVVPTGIITSSTAIQSNTSNPIIPKSIVEESNSKSKLQYFTNTQQLKRFISSSILSNRLKLKRDGPSAAIAFNKLNNSTSDISTHMTNSNLLNNSSNTFDYFYDDYLNKVLRFSDAVNSKLLIATTFPFEIIEDSVSPMLLNPSIKKQLNYMSQQQQQQQQPQQQQLQQANQQPQFSRTTKHSPQPNTRRKTAISAATTTTTTTTTMTDQQHKPRCDSVSQNYFFPEGVLTEESRGGMNAEAPVATSNALVPRILKSQGNVKLYKIIRTTTSPYRTKTEGRPRHRHRHSNTIPNTSEFSSTIPSNHNNLSATGMTTTTTTTTYQSSIYPLNTLAHFRTSPSPTTVNNNAITGTNEKVLMTESNSHIYNSPEFESPAKAKCLTEPQQFDFSISPSRCYQPLPQIGFHSPPPRFMNTSSSIHRVAAHSPQSSKKLYEGIGGSGSSLERDTHLEVSPMNITVTGKQNSNNNNSSSLSNPQQQLQHSSIVQAAMNSSSYQQYLQQLQQQQSQIAPVEKVVYQFKPKWSKVNNQQSNNVATPKKNGTLVFRKYKEVDATTTTTTTNFAANSSALSAVATPSTTAIHASKRSPIKGVCFNDPRFLGSFSKAFMDKLGVASSRAFSEVLFKDVFVNVNREELETILGQFLLLSNHDLKFMEGCLPEIFGSQQQHHNHYNNQEQSNLGGNFNGGTAAHPTSSLSVGGQLSGNNVGMSIKARTEAIFTQSIYVKLGTLREYYPAFARLKELHLLRGALSYLQVQNARVLDELLDTPREGEITLFWKEFLKFKAFFIENKWNRHEKIMFIYYVINPKNRSTISIARYSILFPDTQKGGALDYLDFQQMRAMKEYLCAPASLAEDGGILVTRIYDCLLKETYVHINDILRFFLTKS